MTDREKQVLKALYAGRGLKFMRAQDLFESHPATFGNWTPPGMHMILASLVIKGYAGKASRMPVRYYITPAGISAIQREAGVP